MVSVMGDSLVASGSAESFKSFASYFDFSPDATEQHHNHHEYFDGNKYIHRASIPLVIGIRNNKT